MTSISGYFYKLFGIKQEPVAKTLLETADIKKATSLFLTIEPPNNTIKALFFTGKKFIIKSVPFREVNTEIFFKTLRLTEKNLKNRVLIPQEMRLDLHKTQIAEIRRGLNLTDDLSERMQNLTLTPYTEHTFIESCIDSLNQLKTGHAIPYLFSQARRWIDVNTTSVIPTSPIFAQLFTTPDPMRVVLEYCGQETLTNIALAFPKELSHEIIQKFPIRHEFPKNKPLHHFRRSIQKQKLLEIAQINVITTTCITIGKKSESNNIENQFIPFINQVKSPVELNVIGSPVADEALGKLKVPIPKIDLSDTKVRGSILHSPSFTDTSSVNLSHCKELDEQNLFSPRCPTPQSVDLSCTDITGDSFSSSFYKKIKQLTLFNCLKVQDKFLETISSEQLEFLDLEAATGITGSSFSATSLQKLKYLSIMSCMNVTDKSLKRLASPILEILKADQTKITGDCFSFGSPFGKLKMLSLSRCLQLQEKNLEAYECTQLKNLNIAGTKMQGDFLLKKQYQTLEELSLEYCENISDELILKLSLPNLKVLNLQGTNISKKCLASPLFKTVEKLTLSFCPNLRQEDTQLLKAPALNNLIYEWFPYSDTSSTEDFSPLPDFLDEKPFKD